MYSKPIEYDAEGMKVFRFPVANILRHPRVCMKLLPFFCLAILVTIVLMVTTTNLLFSIVLPIIAMHLLVVIGLFLTQSNVSIAVMDGLLIIEETSKCFEEHHEFHADQIINIAVETDGQNRANAFGTLKIYLRSGENYTLPCGKKHDLDTLADDIWQTLNPESVDTESLQLVSRQMSDTSPRLRTIHES